MEHKGEVNLKRVAAFFRRSSTGPVSKAIKNFLNFGNIPYYTLCIKEPNFIFPLHF